MLIYFSEFKKSLKKLPIKIQLKVKEKFIVLENDEFNEILNNHKLHGEYDGFRSINITGDLRIIYKKVNDNTFSIYTIGTHSQLY